MNKELKFWMIVVIVVISLILCIVKLAYFSEDVEIMMRPEEIHGAVEVKSVVDIAESESLGGDYLVLCDTAEQFLGLVPKGETIYTYFEPGEKESKFPIEGVHYQLNRKYVAFVNELRVIYNDSYGYQKGDRRYWIEGWDWSSEGVGHISFHYDNKGCIIIVIAVIVVIAFSAFIASGFKDMPWWMP